MCRIFSRLLIFLLIAGLFVGTILLAWPLPVRGASRTAVMPPGADTRASRAGLIPGGRTPVPTLPAPSPTPTPALTNTVSQYLPLVISPGTPALELLNVYARDEAGALQAAFLPGEPHTYHADGVNNRTTPLAAALQFYQSGPCGASQIYSETLTLPPGAWGQVVPSPGLGCTGIYTTTVYLAHEELFPTLSTLHVVNPPSTVLISGFQGFDRCHLPTVDEMQTWWNSSPYYVYNLYLGGISFFCWEEIPDPVWVHQVAQQGWTFIQAWVGPQAPCTSFTHRMSANPGTAYLEGRAEAEAAAEASRRAGLFENGVIYYDIEGYPNASTACRTAVSSFLRGWTERLHELGLRSGSYGSPCNSYITDWASINPPPDDVWIAHWYRPAFDPAATVWDAPCLSNSLWANHRRIKQYAGGHIETWGGVALEIDTDVLDGEITGLFLNLNAEAGPAPSVLLRKSGRPISRFDLVGTGVGWILTEGRLMQTVNSGTSWQVITPAGMYVIDAAFLNAAYGWVLGWSEATQRLQVARTLDGGNDWSWVDLPVSSPTALAQVETGWLNVLDERTAWVALKLPSGSNFSVGQLFATTDGGENWQERSLPIGEPVVFQDKDHGWLTGGPAGDRIFRTRDGGVSWEPVSLDLPAGSRVSIHLPSFPDDGSSRLPVLLDKPSGWQLAYLKSNDRGENWYWESEHGPDQVGGSGLLSGPELAEAWAARAALGGDLPTGTIALDFYDKEHAWALIQEGHCFGKSLNGAAGGRVSCEQAWLLLATDDGGGTWHEILR